MLERLLTLLKCRKAGWFCGVRVDAKGMRVLSGAFRGRFWLEIAGFVDAKGMR